MIDWSKHDEYPENTVTCSCGSEFRSHAKAVFDGPKPTIASRKPCPQCGATRDHRSSRSDPELMTIGGR